MEGETWSSWNGSAINVNNSPYKLCLRGKNNTQVTSSSSGAYFAITTPSSPRATGVECSGNIMTLLDYENPSGATMGTRCFERMFYSWSKLTSAPSLPATTLAERCYNQMFYGCTGLTTAPALPATTLADSCYVNIFKGCTGLTRRYSNQPCMNGGISYQRSAQAVLCPQSVTV